MEKIRTIIHTRKILRIYQIKADEIMLRFVLVRIEEKSTEHCFESRHGALLQGQAGLFVFVVLPVVCSYRASLGSLVVRVIASPPLRLGWK